MKFLEFLNESYYHSFLIEYFEKILKVKIVPDSNREAYDIFHFESDKDLNHFSKIISDKLDQIYKRLNRQKNPAYTINLKKIDSNKYELNVHFMVNMFRKKVIYHGTHVDKVASIMKNGITPKDEPVHKPYINNKDEIGFLLYNGSFFFGAKSLAKKFAQAKYGSEWAVVMIDNSESKYNEFSYYEDDSKEKYGYSHSFFINKTINPKDIYL